MIYKKNNILLFLFLVIFSSCRENLLLSYSLKETEECVRFTLDNDTRSSIMTMFVYCDKDGKEYLTFQNPNKNDILFYDLETCNLAFKIRPEVDGPNGVAFILGYYIHSLDSIFLTTRSFEEISLIDRMANVIDKYEYRQTIDGLALKRFYSTTSLYTPAEIIDNKMYIVSGCNRWQEPNPVSAYIDLSTKEVCTLPFNYPVFPTAINKNKRAGIEEQMSRCFDGENFIYSFYFDENIYVASIDHKNVRKVAAKSQYIKEVEYIDDFGKTTIEQACELANYGNLIYDKYRKLYYRIVFPRTTLEKGVKGYELREYGRKNFSILILDDKFNVVGETKFPDYTYNPRLIFIKEEGVYISNSHYLNPDYSDDVLSFVKFELVKN